MHVAVPDAKIAVVTVVTCGATITPTGVGMTAERNVASVAPGTIALGTNVLPVAPVIARARADSSTVSRTARTGTARSVAVVTGSASVRPETAVAPGTTAVMIAVAVPTVARTSVVMTVPEVAGMIGAGTTREAVIVAGMPSARSG